MRFQENRFEDLLFFTTSSVEKRGPFDELMPFIDKENIARILFPRLEECFEKGFHNYCYVENPDNSKTIHLNTLKKQKNWVVKMLELGPAAFIADQHADVHHLCCPSCHEFSLYSDFFEPENGWDALLKEYADKIIAKKLFITLDNFRYNGISMVPKEDILWNIEDKDEFSEHSLETVDKYPDWYPYVSERFKKAESGNVVMRCPKCGKVLEIKTENVRIMVPEGYKKENIRFLTRVSDKWREHNKFYINYEIFEEGDKIVYSTIKWHLFPNINGHMVIEKTNSRMTFNAATGQAYQFRDYDFNKKTPLNPDKKLPRMRNATYNPWQIVGTNESAEAVAKVICKKKGIPDIDVSELANKFSYTGETVLSLINRYGNFGKDFIYHFLSLSWMFSAKEKRDLFLMQTDRRIFQKYLKKYGISGKRMTKMCAANPMLIFYDRLLRKIGFKNIDARVFLLNNGWDWLINFIRVNLHSKKFDEVLKQDDTETPALKFITDYSEIKSEIDLAKRVVETSDYCFNDTVRFYNRICETLEIQKEEKRLLFAGSLLDIHDRIYRIDCHIDTDNYYIPYVEEELAINCKVDGYTFELAKTSEEMKSCGAIMHICVGSYRELAFQKECNIVIMRDKDRKFAACIEICAKDGKISLKQFKDYCNQAVSPEKIPSALSFLKNNKIEYEECYDAKNSGFFETEPAEDFERIPASGYKIFESRDDFKKVFIEVDKKNILDGLGNRLFEARNRPQPQHQNVAPDNAFALFAIDGPFI